MQFKIPVISCLQCAKSDYCKRMFRFYWILCRNGTCQSAERSEKIKFKFVTEITLRTEVSQAM
jgi:hypothetical protein